LRIVRVGFSEIIKKIYTKKFSLIRGYNLSMKKTLLICGAFVVLYFLFQILPKLIVDIVVIVLLIIGLEFLIKDAVKSAVEELIDEGKFESKVATTLLYDGDGDDLSLDL
jgi:hypothetical protein